MERSGKMAGKAGRDVKQDPTSLIWNCVLLSVVILGRAVNNVFFYGFVLVSLLMFLFCDHRQCFLLLLYLLPSATILKMGVDSMTFFTILFLLTILKMVMYYGGIPWQLCIWVLILCIYYVLFSGFNQLTTIITMAAGLLMISFIRQDSIDANQAVVTYSLGICFASALALLKESLPIVNRFARNMAIKLGEGNYSTRFSGLHGNPNYYTLDIIIVISALIVLMYTRKPQKIHFFCIVTLSVFGLMSVSKSFLLTWMILIACWFGISMKQGAGNVIKFAFIGIMTAAVVYFFAYDFVNSYLLRFQNDSSGNLKSITTGRSDIWLAYIHEIAGNLKILLLGNGLNTVGKIRKGTHNTYLECLFSLGIVGTTLFLYTVKESMGKILTSKIMWIPLAALLFRMFAIGILTYDNLWFYLAVLEILSKECASQKRGQRGEVLRYG